MSEYGRRNTSLQSFAALCTDIYLSITVVIVGVSVAVAEGFVINIIVSGNPDSRATASKIAAGVFCQVVDHAGRSGIICRATIGVILRTIYVPVPSDTIAPAQIDVAIACLVSIMIGPGEACGIVAIKGAITLKFDWRVVGDIWIVVERVESR